MMLLFMTVAVILQAGIGRFPFALSLAVAAGLSTRPAAAMSCALAGSVLLETISIASLGTLSLPLLLTVPATFLLSQRLFRRGGIGGRAALLAAACALAAALSYGAAMLLSPEPLPWSMQEPLGLAVWTLILAGLWLWIIERFKTRVRYGLSSA